ncbi:MAG TPA: hypothetical protein VG297_04465 [Bryobacteraceae bacterium]|nr:hypothetical protein [Bryobacteraceae bacterium]
MERSAQLMSLFLPGHEMEEARNKLQAFRLFAYADRELRFPAGPLPPLEALVRRAFDLSHHQRIFAIEGAGHYYTGAASRPLKGLLQDPALPDCAMVSLHAGMGTSLASTILSKLRSDPSKTMLRDAVSRFFDLCRANARVGWYENAIEPLGLSVRTLHPHLLTRVGNAVSEIDAGAQRLYWHGAGRSLYFVPMNFVTFGGAHERALRTAIEEAPTVDDRRNAVAGLVWAITLVNVSNPAVLKSLLKTAEAIRMPNAVRNGIVSALIVWKHMVPEDAEFLPRYSELAPGTSADAARWNDFVATPAREAFAEVFPALHRQDRVASVFQFHESLTEPGAASKASHA